MPGAVHPTCTPAEEGHLHHISTDVHCSVCMCADHACSCLVEDQKTRLAAWTSCDCGQVDGTMTPQRCRRPAVRSAVWTRACVDTPQHFPPKPSEEFRPTQRLPPDSASRNELTEAKHGDLCVTAKQKFLFAADAGECEGEPTAGQSRLSPNQVHNVDNMEILCNQRWQT